MSMKGGYVLVDAGSVDLTKTGETTQTVTGLYNKLVSALGENKMIIVKGFTMGSGKPLAPVPVSAYKGSSTTVIVNINWLSLSVANTNVVTTTDYKYVPEG